MRGKTKYRAGIRCYAEDFALLRDIHARLQELNPNQLVSMPDAMKVCVNSGHAAVTGGQLPATIAAPPLTIRSDQAA